MEEVAKLHVIETRGEDIVWDENARCAMLDFKAGANWQKQQMMKGAIAGTVNEPECLWWRIISEDLEGQFVVENNLHDGDEVKLIVIKENDYGKED